jgi:hypothetical protein
MTIRLEHSLAYVEIALTYRGNTLSLDSVILDTGSASTLFASDCLLEVGVVPEPRASLREVHEARPVTSSEITAELAPKN